LETPVQIHRRRSWWPLAALALIAALAALAWWPSGEHTAQETQAANAPLSRPGWFGSAPVTSEAPAPAASASASEARPFNPLDTMEMPTFRATPQGKLVLDLQTRNDLERMVALFANDHGLQRLDLLSADLPAQARQELRDMYQRYVQYSQAMAANIPTSQTTLDEAAKQQQTLHELRQQYFGPDAADALFSAEEAAAAQLMDIMRKQTDAKASIEDRAAKAQDLWKKEHPNGP
jgi:hypothetical protein